MRSGNGTGKPNAAGAGVDEDPLKSADKQMESEAERVKKSVATPLEKLRETESNLAELRTKNLIDAETFLRALDKAQQEYDKTLEVKKGKMEDIRPRTAEEISPGLGDKFSPDKPENRLADAMRRGSLADYQTRIANRGQSNPEAEALKYQKEALAEAKKNNALINESNTILRTIGVDTVEIA
jgi:hypothetical protein